MHLVTRRISRETNGDGDYVDIGEYGADWKHNWNQRFRSRVQARYADADYVGSSRNDELYRFGVRIDYSLRRWIDIDAGYRYEKRSSNGFALSYDRNVLFVGVSLSL